MKNPENTSRLMLDFACSWRRFGGGPDEDIMVRFGLTAPEYFSRLEGIVKAGHHNLDEQTATEILKVCRRRLWTYRTGHDSLRAPA
ncbi:hypothetical protein [Antrihabitans stalactiti]|uniref:DUF3263 domain-containing protein n=1 Tax=Antrihabitans stalactiti TaxID=2584121 RepID=A0A848K985_9NOCA|nr:hypothetical protein [Antrihabitans stalactiti]NMN93998.1 hypothetical protein [Antrihabitans stalactiti]